MHALICSDVSDALGRAIAARAASTTTALHLSGAYTDSPALTLTPHNRIVASRRDSRFSGRVSWRSTKKLAWIGKRPVA